MAPPLTIDSTLGAVLIGFALSCGVYGILLTQVFSYFRNYPGDKSYFKYLVSSCAQTDLCADLLNFLP